MSEKEINNKGAILGETNFGSVERGVKKGSPFEPGMAVVYPLTRKDAIVRSFCVNCGNMIQHPYKSVELLVVASKMDHTPRTDNKEYVLKDGCGVCGKEATIESVKLMKWEGEITLPFSKNKKMLS